MTAAGGRQRPDWGLAAAEAALDLFFETWRLAAGLDDQSRTRRLGLGALRVLQQVTAIGLEETRAGARQRLREARVELRRLVQVVETDETDETDRRRCWGGLAASLGKELSRLNQVLCSQDPCTQVEPPQPSTLDPQLTTHDS
jgi:hypothetical protein